MSPEDVKSNSAQVNKMIQDTGLEINSDEVKFSNTLKAHTLLQYAKEKNLDNELAAELYYAYFTEGAYLNKDETLIQIASKVEIDKETVIEVIKSKKFIDQVHADRNMGVNMGVSSVPHVIIDGKAALSGAQSKQAYKDAIKNI